MEYALMQNSSTQTRQTIRDLTDDESQQLQISSGESLHSHQNYARMRDDRDAARQINY